MSLTSPIDSSGLKDYVSPVAVSAPDSGNFGVIETDYILPDYFSLFSMHLKILELLCNVGSVDTHFCKFLVLLISDSDLIEGPSRISLNCPIR